MRFITNASLPAWLHEKYDSIYYLFYESFIKPVELRGDRFDDFDEGDYFEALTLIGAIPLLGPPRPLREVLRYPTYAEYHQQLGIPMEADSVIGWAWGLSEEEQKKYAELEREIAHPPFHMWVITQRLWNLFTDSINQ